MYAYWRLEKILVCMNSSKSLPRYDRSGCNKEFDPSLQLQSILLVSNQNIRQHLKMNRKPQIDKNDMQWLILHS